MSKIPVSVCMIAKNEEKYIEECLKRLKPYGFEIVVTDTGSTDRTREIASAYADKVLDFAWIDDFSAARNFCVENASNDWILILDCDEYVNSINVDELRRLMHQFPRYVGSIRLKNLRYVKGNKEISTDDVIRFYDRRHYRFVQPIHEQITYMEDEKIGAPMTNFILPMEVIHHGYALTKEEMNQKNQRNLELLHKAIEKEPDNPYLHFQTAQSEKATGHIGDAIELYTRTLQLNDNPEYTYVEISIRTLASLYVQMDRISEAVELMEAYAPQCSSAKFNYMHANVMLDSGNTLKALVLYIKTSILPDADTLGDDLLHCYEHIIKIYMDMGNGEMVWAFREKYEQCIIERNRILENS